MSHDHDRNVPDGVYAMATALLDSGEADVAVERHLVDAGVSFEMASRIITEHHRATAAAEKSGGRSDVQFGAIAFLGGVMVMVIGGTSSFVGWLGMIVGAMSVLNGLLKQRSLRTAGS
ncbi:MAG TPA: hypothetical protein VKE51_42995 [Vicinamibacterales bacterium]|nr:hypothetical protein [Vicinamibacterales bacterium]